MQTAAHADPNTASAVLAERHDDRVVLTLPHTDYRIHLDVKGESPELAADNVGKSVAGRIEAQARRIDVVHTGGRYLEPVYGRPRRLQGRIVATDRRSNTITVQCPCPIVCHLMAPQLAQQFEVGQLVSFDIERGATFRPM